VSLAPFLLCAALILPAAAQPDAPLAPACGDPACAELLKIQTAYEQAIRDNNPDLLLPYLKEDFTGSMLFRDVQGREGLKALWQAAAKDIGQGHSIHRYRIKLKPAKISVNGDQATAEGSTEETADCVLGRILFNSNWKANLVRQNGSWKLASMDSTPDPGGTIGGMLKRMWRGPEQLMAQVMPARKHPAVVFQGDGDPEYDGWRRDLRR
jgi:hypothetical protein